MPIPTSRTKEKGTIVIHQELCIGCGKCVSVCNGIKRSFASIHFVK